MSHPILSFEGISKRFFGISVLKSIDLSLQAGRVLGLVGENGAGKSTLMNVLGGVTRPDAGLMRLDGATYAPREPGEASAAGVGFIHQELNLFTNLSVAENIFIEHFPRLGWLPFVARRRIAARTKEVLVEMGLNLSPTTLVGTLSPGERQLVEIAKVLTANARIMIFDEPTTSLTAKETQVLFDIIRRLKAQGVAIVYISHILGDVFSHADDIAVLRDGALVAKGPIAEFPIPKMISCMVGRDVKNAFPAPKPTSRIAEILRVQNLSQPGIVRGIDLTIHSGEIVGVFGLMGAGRTELARMLFGLDPYDKGSVLIDGKALPPNDPQASIAGGLAFVTENRRDEGLLMSVPIVENIGTVALPNFAGKFLGFIDRKRLYDKATKTAIDLRIKANSYTNQSVKSLSGGNQQKVVVAKWLMAQPKVLIVDEPTRGVDVGAKYEVYTIISGLAAQGSGILFISSELEELMAVAHRIVVMNRGEIIGRFERHEFTQERIMRAAFRQQAEEKAA
jgi:ABC-type sugar transport system ATPase subunit